MTQYVIEKSLLQDNNGMIVLGNTFFDIETEDECKQVSLVAKTKKGWVSKKKIAIEKAVVIGDYDDDYALLDPEQAETLISLFSRENCKEWFKQSRGIDVTTAFALAGCKYGWVYDRIDELG